MPALLTPRALNRATLARQHLLARAPLEARAALTHLVGLQAQAPTPPYFGLWTRLEGFRPEHLSAMIERREAVRIALMRSTIHLVTAAEALALRPVVQPALDRQVRGSYGRALEGLDPDALADALRSAFDDGPLTFAAIGRYLAERWPDRDPSALANAARALVPLVQVPPRGLWRRAGPAAHVPAHDWLGQPLPTEAEVPAGALESLALRYLRAFGPASVLDVQTWSGLTRLGAVLDALRPRLATFRDEAGRVLFDLPDASRPDPDAPAPPRFLPEFDNLLLSHADRSRVLPDRHRGRVVRGGMIPGTVLVDGVVSGTWKLDRKRAPTLRVTLFERPVRRELEAMEEEAGRLLAFAAPDGGGEVVVVRA